MPSKQSYPRYWSYRDCGLGKVCLVCYAKGEHLWHLFDDGKRTPLCNLFENYAENKDNHHIRSEHKRHPNDPHCTNPLQIQYLQHILKELREENRAVKEKLP